MTIAGRALDKHGSRTPTVFPKATGNIASKNAQGQFQLDDILTHPQGYMDTSKGFIDFRKPGGEGARFTEEGTLKGFLQP